MLLVLSKLITIKAIHHPDHAHKKKGVPNHKRIREPAVQPGKSLRLRRYAGPVSRQGVSGWADNKNGQWVQNTIACRGQTMGASEGAAPVALQTFAEHKSQNTLCDNKGFHKAESHWNPARSTTVCEVKASARAQKNLPTL